MREKPELESLGDADRAQSILEYHQAITEAPVLYEKNQGPQEQVGGVWVGSSLPTRTEANDLAYVLHQAEIATQDDAEFDLEHVAFLLGGGDPEEAELHTTNLNRGLNWMWPLIGQMPYGWWTSGAVPSDQPAWAINKPPPDLSYLRQRTVFCAGLPNLLLRRVGKRVPTAGNLLYDGGTYAYGVYFRSVSIPFSVERVQPGDLLLDFYQGSAHQGHLAVVLDGEVLLQSYDGGQFLEGAYNGPGLSRGISAAASARYNDYDIIVRRQNWIDYVGDEF